MDSSPSDMPAILNALLHLSNFKNPFLQTLVPSIGLAYGIQAAVAIPSIFARSERFYDPSGSLTYISCTVLSLFLPAIRARAAARLSGTSLPPFPSLFSAFNGTGGPLGFNWRQMVISVAMIEVGMSSMSPVPTTNLCSGRLPHPTDRGRRRRLALQVHL